MFGAGSRMALAASVVVIAAAVGVGMAAGGSPPAHGRGPLAGALSTLPRTTTVASFTDWQYIANHYGLTEAMDRDLATRSVIIDDRAGLKRWLGVRLRDVRWEMFGQSPTGEAVVLRLKRSMPSAARLRKSGFRQDKSSHVWNATGRLAGQEPIYAAVAPMPRDGVVVMGSKSLSVAAVRQVVAGKLDSFVGDRGVAQTAQALAGVHAALIQTSGLGCDATKVGVEPERARQAAAAEARFGRLVRYSVLGRGLRDGASKTQRFEVAMTFDSAATASKQARIRAALSHGPFLGRSGDIADVLRLRAARSDGPVTILSYDHPADSEYLMTGHGPLMPASC